MSEATPRPVLPPDVVALVPMRNVVLFPHVLLPIAVGRPKSVAALMHALAAEAPLGIVLQKDAGVDDPGAEALCEVGTLAQVLQHAAAQPDRHQAVCQGLQRFRLIELVPGYPFLAGRIERIPESAPLTPRLEALDLQLRERAVELVALLPGVPAELAHGLQAARTPWQLGDVVAGLLDIEIVEKQRLLETVQPADRLQQVLALVNRRIEVLRLSQEIGERTKEKIDDRQREYLLREQLKTIQHELGEDKGDDADIVQLEQRIATAGMNAETEAHARKELARLKRLSEGSGEQALLRNYLDWLVELPWGPPAESPIDLAAARAVLDADHHGLARVKQRILEYLAVQKLNPAGRAPILCFVGPPGVGKTSLGQSIARALGRPFVRVSLGGVHDEAEIRGHRRTYIGALPGNIVQGLRKAASRGCVMMLDEVDKLGAGAHGDPSAALLEVLDPEQNASFRDNYLGLPFDLSRVVFIATANVIEQVPGPVRDRMEVIELPGYTEEEKLQIAQTYLVPRQRAQCGLQPAQCSLAPDALRALVTHYTREAGVRQLEREIGRLMRHAAMQVAQDAQARLEVDAAGLAAILGPAPFEREGAARVSLPGVATGLAWTPAGGDILFIEATRTLGKGRLILTGQLGEVMKESAQAALTLVKARFESLGIDAGAFEEADVHVHVPAGAIPKDGPSAGVAMFVALASLFTGRPVRHDLAMTGEISLRGLVLPVGGIKEKLLAAQRAGVGGVLLPARNEKDLYDVPASVTEGLRIVWLHGVDNAIAAALAPVVPTLPVRETVS
ncbi:endopeptidase La [Aquabacterium sp.]|uniref:endopeptidase La n=1 Tax=Aquabacterium sp. TaxID=1872578 RepID=UPI003784BF3B